MRPRPLQSLSTFLKLVGERLKKSDARKWPALPAIPFEQLVLACASVARATLRKIAKRSAAWREGSYAVADAVKDYLAEIKAEKPGARSKVCLRCLDPAGARRHPDRTAGDRLHRPVARQAGDPAQARAQ
jgi:hypothetical protein